MSEHKVGEFVKAHRRGEIAAAAGILITGAAAAGINLSKRRSRQMGVEDAKNPLPVHELPLEERAKLLAFEPNSDQIPDLTTKVAAEIFWARHTAVELAVSEAIISTRLAITDPEVLKLSLAALEDYHFIEPVILKTDPTAAAWMPMHDLTIVEADEMSMPLLLAISERAV